MLEPGSVNLGLAASEGSGPRSTRAVEVAAARLKSDAEAAIREEKTQKTSSSTPLDLERLRRNMDRYRRVNRIQ